ncbi:MAG: hypothetical protein K8W52_43325 [Deltaproteobacteria bacterium]|nr:hypothetical protein [Deltaproteobacteria bacterium]
MTLPWFAPTLRGDGAARRTDAALRELRARAATYYRLGYTAERATARLAATVAWEFDPPSKTGPHLRPAALSDAAIAALVRETYARHPA